MPKFDLSGENFGMDLNGKAKDKKRKSTEKKNMDSVDIAPCLSDDETSSYGDGLDPVAVVATLTGENVQQKSSGAASRRPRNDVTSPSAPNETVSEAVSGASGNDMPSGSPLAPEAVSASVFQSPVSRSVSPFPSSAMNIAVPGTRRKTKSSEEKAPMMNIRYTPDNYVYMRRESMVRGMSVTAFANWIVDQYKADPKNVHYDPSIGVGFFE